MRIIMFLSINWRFRVWSFKKKGFHVPHFMVVIIKHYRPESLWGSAHFYLYFFIKLYSLKGWEKSLEIISSHIQDEDVSVNSELFLWSFWLVGRMSEGSQASGSRTGRPAAVYFKTFTLIVPLHLIRHSCNVWAQLLERKANCFHLPNAAAL